MTPSLSVRSNTPTTSWRVRIARLGLPLTILTAGLLIGVPSAAQVLGNPTWKELSSAEQNALQPLQAQWDGIEAQRKQKWRDVATRYPTMTPEQQARTSSRMVEWAGMTPAQRNAARLQFEQVKQVPATERQARWDAYQSLPPEQRDALTKQAATREATPVPAPKKSEQPQTKSNIVQPNRPSAPLQPVGPATVKAAVGASTRPISQSPTPPRHQQAGLPKIAASPGFVDSTTLLPQRGPQGAAAEPARAAQ
jgi:Protein of unknown function (DUF3106)